jgi:hypothetical protein
MKTLLLVVEVKALRYGLEGSMRMLEDALKVEVGELFTLGWIARGGRQAAFMILSQGQSAPVPLRMECLALV